MGLRVKLPEGSALSIELSGASDLAKLLASLDQDALSGTCRSMAAWNLSKFKELASAVELAGGGAPVSKCQADTPDTEETQLASNETQSQERCSVTSQESGPLKPEEQSETSQSPPGSPLPHALGRHGKKHRGRVVVPEADSPAILPTWSIQAEAAADTPRSSLNTKDDDDVTGSWALPGSVHSEGDQGRTSVLSFADLQEYQREYSIQPVKRRAPRTNTHGRTSELPMFNNPDQLKHMVRSHLSETPKYRVEDQYSKVSLCGRIAVHPLFEKLTLGIIAFNAIWMAVDTDYNDEEILLNAHPLFVVCENFFCFSFFLELSVRFLAFERKLRAFQDSWFIFDLCMVSLMVFETWFLTLLMGLSPESSRQDGQMGDATILRLAKMLRLLRIMRIAKLMRSMPEFFILIKAVSAASRSAFFTLLFLFIILYVYSIAFVQLLDGTDVGDKYFSTVMIAVQSLFVHGAMADNAALVAKQVGEESVPVMLMFLSVLLVAAITVMNIMIGVLCEAVSAVADTERDSMQVALVEESLKNILDDGADEDEDGLISKEEFVKVLESRKAVCALRDIGIDVIGLVDAADSIFMSCEDGVTSTFDRKLTFEEFMTMLLALRGENKARVKDIIDLKKDVATVLRHLNKLRFGSPPLS
eukprot:TRINITY_DN108405_c0_g1_i1.p1 TRINITY_DN108405_c0_g1~~TRINITY_DN108405_c0_g1_i1.p1  ORF type:complete len:656 (+),score=115.27 TRINITY_DN108405_c0_g1_i1:36-1970(+)